MAKRRRASTHTESAKQRQIPVIPYIPKGTEIIFADGAYVTHHEGMFIVSFVQVEHPLASTDEERERIREVRSRCVSRVAIAANRMPAVIKVLQDTFNNLLEQLQAASSENLPIERIEQ